MLHVIKEYQGKHLRVVPLDLVLGVVSIGHYGSTPAPGEKQAALIER
jgi:hypothetical protein